MLKEAFRRFEAHVEDFVEDAASHRLAEAHFEEPPRPGEARGERGGGEPPHAGDFRLDDGVARRGRRVEDAGGVHWKSGARGQVAAAAGTPKRSTSVRSDSTCSRTVTG